MLCRLAVVVLGATIAGGGEPDEHLPVGERLLSIPLVAMVVITGLLRPFYLAHAKANDNLKPHQRKRWRFALGLYGPFSMPLYWWRYIRPQAPERDSPEHGQPPNQPQVREATPGRLESGTTTRPRQPAPDNAEGP